MRNRDIKSSRGQRHRLDRSPLDEMLADHQRQRTICDLCEELADAEQFDPQVVRRIITHIRFDQAMHVLMEDEDLFPMLRRRARREDEIGPVIDQLVADHENDARLAARFVAALDRLLENPNEPPTASLRRALRTYAEHERRHLAIENAIVIPLAAVRLSAKDMAMLAERTAARRGTVPERDGAG